MEANPDQILQRLEELRRWQEEQQNALITKQMAQREMLHLEKNKLYEMFGISLNSTGCNANESENTDRQENHDDDDDNDDGSQLHPGLLQEIHNAELEMAEPNLNSIRDEEVSKYVSPKRLTTVCEEAIEKLNTEPPEIPSKRSFLRRGEGLQSRFRMNPDDLRLNNLPKYKYAGSHRKFFRNRVTRPQTSSKEEPANQTRSDVAGQTTASASVPVIHKIASDESCGNVLRETRSNVSVQDTPTRELIRHQQREIDELNLFEHIEANTRSFAQDHRKSAQSPELAARLSPDETIDNSSAAQGRVRFLSQVQVNEATEMSDSESAVSYEEEDGDVLINQTSTPNTRTAFQAFKSQLFGSKSSTAHQPLDDTTIVADTSSAIIPAPNAAIAMARIQQQSEEMKQKMIDLEREILLFRTQNASLTKMKQQLELDRVHMDAERTDIEERLNDERCKMEVYLHDERMKLLAEKEALDRRAKELRGPNRKEREETAHLKAQVATLETELATREQRHIAAQGRLRAQIRLMEKDLKDYSYDMENMKKENKKLETENVRLRRQGNNKMLNEINKNIAKLAVVPAKEKDLSAKTNAVKSLPVRSRSEPRVETPNLDESFSSSHSGDEEHANLSNYYQPIDKAKSMMSTTSKEQLSVATSPKALPNVASDASDPPSIDDQQNCKREILNEDGSRDILYPNGNLKKVSKDAMLIRMLYFNKDVKETNITEGTVKYYYAATNTWHTSYLDGLEILEFPK